MTDDNKDSGGAFAVSAEERTMQVPVSLIVFAEATMRNGTQPERDQMAARLDALLSQPTPSDDEWPEDDEEFCDRCFAGADSPEHHAKCVETGFAYDGESAAPSAPKWHEVRSIADMAPGTTFWARFHGTDRLAFLVIASGNPWSVVDTGTGASYFPDAFDPSTIRDVTPPITESTK